MKNKRESNKVKQLCCFVIIGATMILSGNSSWALTEGQKAAESFGAQITWFELAPGFTDCYIHDLGVGLYELSMSNSDTGAYQTAYVNASGEFVLKPGSYEMVSTHSSSDDDTSILLKGSSDYKLLTPEGITSIVGSESFKDISFFRNGFATVTLKSTSHKGVIDRNGNMVFEDKEGKYQDFEFLGSGIFTAKISDNTFQFLNESGIPIMESAYETGWSFQIREDKISAMKNGKFGYLDLKGKEIIPFVYDDARSFSEGFAAVSKNGKWGFIDSNGSEVVPLIYDNVYSFLNGLAPVAMKEKWGMIDKDGKIQIPLEYEQLYQDDEGVLQGTKDGKSYPMDFYGKPIDMGDSDYSYIYKDEYDGFRVAKESDGRTIYTYLNSSKEVAAGWKEFVLYPCGDQLYIGKKSGEYPPGVVPPHDYSQKFALFDAEGNNLTGFKYANVGDYFNNYQVVTKYYYNGAGLLNRYGAEVLPTVFDQILLTDSDYALVEVHDSDTGSNSRAGFFKIPDSFADKKTTRPVTVYLNGVELYFDSEPLIKNQKAMVPLRKIFEALGTSVDWDAATRTVTAVSNDRRISLTIGSDAAAVNEEVLHLDAAPFIQNDLTFVPLRFVSESLGADVKWDSALRRVIITKQ